MSAVKNIKRGFAPNLIMFIALLAVAVPFAWVVMASFRRGNVLTGGLFDFGNLGLDNYLKVFQSEIPQNFVNSIIACTLASVLSVGVGVVAAYGFSRFSFKGSKVLFWCLLVVQLVPAVSMVVPLYKLWADFGLFNSLIGLGIAYAGLNTAVCLLLLKGFVDDIPRELDEAAAIDGCRPWGTFWRVILPLLKPAMTSAGIFVLVTTWQEFVIASSLMNDSSAYPLTVGLQNLSTQYSTDYGGIMAGSVITALPVIIIFAVFQKQFVQTVTGGVKA